MISHYYYSMIFNDVWNVINKGEKSFQNLFEWLKKSWHRHSITQTIVHSKKWVIFYSKKTWTMQIGFSIFLDLVIIFHANDYNLLKQHCIKTFLIHLYVIISTTHAFQTLTLISYRKNLLLYIYVLIQRRWLFMSDVSIHSGWLSIC